MAAQWPGAYTDAHGRETVSIRSEGTSLAVEIREVLFTGLDFDDLEPAPGAVLDVSFTISHGMLTDYELEWDMPVQDVTPGVEHTAILHCHLTLGSPGPPAGRAQEELALSLDHAGTAVRTTAAHGWLEDALADIQR